MQRTDLLLIAVLFYPAISGIASLIITLISYRWTNKYKLDECGHSNQHLYVLLPAYKEQIIVEETLLYYKKIAEKFNNISVYVITNSLEVFDNNFKCTTETLINKIVHDKSVNINHIHYQGGKRGKSTQLNYAIEYLGDRISDDDYVVVYDFDARPDVCTFSTFNNIIIRGLRPDIIQQPVLPINAYYKVSSVGQTDSLIHIIRAYSKEIFVWRCVKYFSGFFRAMLFDTYCVGSGLFVKGRRIKEIGGFPVPVDDIPLGFYAANNGWNFDLIYDCCYTQAYPGFKSAIMSRKSVFSSYVDYILTWKKNRDILKLISGTTREFIVNTFGFFIWISSSVLCKNNAELIVSSLILYIFVKIQQLYLGRFVAYKKTNVKLNISLSNIFLAVIYPLWRIIPGLYSLIFYIRNGRTICAIKTDRL